MSLPGMYVKQVRKDFERWPIWTPNTIVKVGTVGRFEGRIFQASRDLAGWGIEVKTKAKAQWSPLRYATKGKSAFRTKQAGSINPGFQFLGKMDAGVDIELRGTGTSVLLAEKHREVYLSNPDNVCTAIRNLIRDGGWRPDRCVVTSCMVAEKFEAIVAKDKGGHVELHSDVNLPAALSSLGGVKAQLTVGTVRESFSHYSVSHATPMFGDPIRVKRGLWKYFGHWYLVDPTDGRFRVEFPANFDAGIGGYRLEWEGDITPEGTRALDTLSDEEFFERVDDQVLENDRAIEAELATVAGQPGVSVSYVEVVPRGWSRRTLIGPIPGLIELEVGVVEENTEEE